MGFSIPANGQIDNMSIKINGHTHFDLVITAQEGGSEVERIKYIYEISVDNMTIEQIKTAIYSWLLTATEIVSLPEGDEEVKVLIGNWTEVT